MTIAPFRQPEEASQEAHHRFLNTLTALDGLMRRALGRFDDPAVREAVAVFGSQLHAFAEVHQSLLPQAAAARVDVAAHFGRLCERLCAAHLAPRGVTCQFRCGPGSLPPDVCQHLGLLLVELVTNAAKHAFTGRSGGLVSVTLRQVHDGWLCLVADDGVGFQGERRGLGARLVHSLVRAMGGELRMHSDCRGRLHACTCRSPPIPMPCDIRTPWTSPRAGRPFPRRPTRSDGEDRC